MAVGDRLQRPRLVGRFKKSDVSLFLTRLFSACAFSVDKELHLVCGGVHLDGRETAFHPRKAPAANRIGEAPCLDRSDLPVVRGVSHEDRGAAFVVPDALTPVGQRSSVAEEVDVAAAGCLVRISSVKALGDLAVQHVPDPGLPEIVPRRPVEIADQIRQLFYQSPVPVKLARLCFGTDEHTVRVFRALRFIPLRAVIVPQHVDLSGGLFDGAIRQIASGQLRQLRSQFAHQRVDLHDELRFGARIALPIPVSDRFLRLFLCQQDPRQVAEHHPRVDCMDHGA